MSDRSKRFLKKAKWLIQQHNIDCTYDVIDLAKDGQSAEYKDIHMTPCIHKIFPMPEEEFYASKESLDAWLISHQPPALKVV